MGDTRILYVHVYPSPLFAAHWSFWIPYLDSKRRGTGDRIHVTGDRLNGFTYEYITDYDPRDDDRSPKEHSVGLIPASSIHPVEATDCDMLFINALDKALREVPPPGPSLNKVVPNSGSNDAQERPKKMEARDCQWWIAQAVEHLVRKGLLRPIVEGNFGEGEDFNLFRQLWPNSRRTDPAGCCCAS